jgi:hypothetical protein
MNSDTRIHSTGSVSVNCQNCKKDFIIETEDFNFYKRIKVPPPTFCSECRLIRRMTWRNERSLFKRPCGKSGKEVITMFHPETEVVIYDRDVWWGDGWEPTNYGKEYNFSKPFFEQWKELLYKTPLVNLGNSNCKSSPYGNHNADCKHCYLIYASYNNERTHYSCGGVGLKDCIDIYKSKNSELCYSDTLCGGSFKVHFSYETNESINSFFLKYCMNLQDCIGCVNLRNKNYCIFNKQYTKEEYEKKKKEINFGSYKALLEFEKRYNEFSINFPNKYANIRKTTGSTGDHIFNSKNIKNSFDIFGETEDSKYIIHALSLKDSYDLYGAGAVASLLYEGIDTGLQASSQLFSIFTHTCMNTYYTYMCFNSKNLFGCIGLRGKQYCILNKQYTKEEYQKLVPKIIEHMDDMPYKDKNGLIYKYGEFFPSELSPFAYNETITQEYFSKTKEEIIKEGYIYRKPIEKDYEITIKSQDLPDDIKNVLESILEEVIACPNNGQELTQCTKAYRIIKAELKFLKNNNIALPRFCPNCRHYKRLKKRNPFRLWTRRCMKKNCKNEFQTSYAPDRPEIIYCEQCYQQEVY